MNISYRKMCLAAMLMTIMVIAGCPHSNVKHPENQKTAPRIMLFTGGHSFEHDSFFEMVYSLGNFHIDTLSQPLANHSLLSDSIDLYDAIVFYDMWQDISASEKEAFLRLTEKGTGLVFLHHSLVSYQQWDHFEEIRGGKYYERGYDYPQEKLSGYKHNIVMEVTVTDPLHTVTKGMDDFKILDEGYSNIGVMPGVTPLLTTYHPDCSDTIGWAHTYKNSKVVYILPGHDNHAWSDRNYRSILANSISWTIGGSVN